MRKFKNLVWEQIDKEFFDRFTSTEEQNHAKSDEVLKRGGADFCSSYADDAGRNLTTQDKVLGYCHRYFRMHYESSLAVLGELSKSQGMVASPSLFVDFGCGPGTSGIAFADFIQGKDFRYVGLDISPEMLMKADELFNYCKSGNTSFCKDFDDLSDVADGVGTIAVAVLNFCFLLAPGTFKGDVTELCETVRRTVDRLKHASIYAIYQNPRRRGFHCNWEQLKRQMEGFSSVAGTPKEITYHLQPNPIYCDILYRDNEQP